jgi:hypothetical protein
MATKVLSGILVTRGHETGQVRIDLDTNRIAEGPEGVWLGKTEMVGSGRYISTPCKIVALREFDLEVRFSRSELMGLRDAVTREKLRIDDVSINERYLEIAWRGDMIEEISYMVIGEVQ